MEGHKGTTDRQKSPGTDDPKFLALSIDIQMAIEGGNAGNNLGSSSGGASGAGGGAGGGTAGGGSTCKGNGRQAWKYYNPDNAETMEQNGRTWKWCKNNYHPKPLWCPRPNCLNRKEYKEQMQSKGTNGISTGGKINTTNDFKVALAAMVSDDEYKTLAEQFFKLDGEDEESS
eukprot:13106090-Ditylum_brightwellii.AAC.1